jgi:hypothetical protein
LAALDWIGSQEMTALLRLRTSTNRKRLRPVQTRRLEIKTGLVFE